MSDEEQIQTALDRLALMREVATKTKTQRESDEAAMILAETESWLVAAVKMAGKSIGEMRSRQARRKAEWVARMVQGTSGLEAQDW